MNKVVFLAFRVPKPCQSIVNWEPSFKKVKEKRNKAEFQLVVYWQVYSGHKHSRMEKIIGIGACLAP